MESKSGKTNDPIQALKAGLQAALQALQRATPSRQTRAKAFHRDLVAQYRKIGEIVDRTNVQEVRPILESLIREGEYIDQAGVLRFNSVALGYLKSLMEAHKSDRRS
jgi:hypothetical protein